MSTEISKDGIEPKVGIAVIKQQYLYHENNTVKDDDNETGVSAPKKAKRGQNKKRYETNRRFEGKELRLCPVLVDVREEDNLPTCKYAGCKHIHDIQQFLASKSADLGEICPVYQATGHCPRGVTCRFSSNHITAEGRNKVNKELYEQCKDCKATALLTKEDNYILRKRKYNFDKANSVISLVLNESGKDSTPNQKETELEEREQKNGDHLSPDPNETQLEEEENFNGVETSETAPEENKNMGSCSGTDSQNPRERKVIDWRNKLLLSPLTTLGNLPFRRICKEWGADITCGEMAMATSLLQGMQSEWALLRRHSSENIFGVQICGNNPYVLGRCVQLVEEKTDVDFIDLNLGCPLEMVCQKGAGSGLLRREKQLKNVIQIMCRATSLPVTVKTRTGLYDDKLVAHKLMPIYTASGVSAITVHGRTKEQRYTKYADWDYINQCAKLAAPTPVFGNGDILSYHDYNSMRSTYPDITGVMVGRGALYKPWIFTEIKEQRDWDISSSERLDILRKFVNYGFEHWGSDTRGVENTRRFLLEWLSFLYRYIPVGLLERVPQRMNERPPRYVGRDDLETLMASPNCANWVKISEMLCGPVPEGFVFLPKHKANAWSSN